MTFTDVLRRRLRGGFAPRAVHATIQRCPREFDLSAADARALEAAELTRDFYALVTDFTEFASGLSLSGLRNSRAGGLLTHPLVRALEALRLSPQGTVQTHDVLRLAQRTLVEGGQSGIFTPLYQWLARKP
jgi:hypothetical protein